MLSRRILPTVTAIAAAGATLLAQTPAAPVRGEVRASHGLVAAGRTFTADAGARLMTAGGNAIDGGVAAIFAAAVTEISHFGLGGEAPIIIYSARDRRVIVINGQGPAPKAANPQMFAGKDAIPGNGPLGATLPAVVDSAAIALARYGTKSLSEVLQPAIELADGFPMYEFLHNYLRSERAASEQYAWTKSTYYANGITPVGQTFRQPNLAATLRALAAAEKAALSRGLPREGAIEAGRDAFYKGPIAREMTAAVREAGGVMTEEDLAGYHGRIEEPATVTYRGYTVHKAGFWNQGPSLLQTLRILEGFDLRTMGRGSADAVHTIVEAIKLGYADRDRYYGDPDFVRVPGEVLLSEPYAAARRRLIDPKKASVEQRPGNPGNATGEFRSAGSLPLHSQDPRIALEDSAAAREPGDTTSIQAADAAGNLFSATPSSGWLLGGAFVAGRTGVPMSNRMQAFNLDPASPNVLAGGKRPRTTLTPTVVMKDGKPFLAIGTPGGDSQDQQILLVLLNIIDFGLDVQAAIEAPRVNSLHPVSSFDNHRAQPGVLEIEASFPAAVQDELKARGHTLLLRRAHAMSTGIVAAGIDPASGQLRGGADLRRERAIVAW
ncbi:MAG TPA: gamma-glutamyltransferase family protein [Vicinamibacterales bacterium]|nr:gamma-glutamyltransferase family protein [Vicinamibacterales bacterium]